MAGALHRAKELEMNNSEAFEAWAEKELYALDATTTSTRGR